MLRNHITTSLPPIAVYYALYDLNAILSLSTGERKLVPKSAIVGVEFLGAACAGSAGLLKWRDKKLIDAKGEIESFLDELRSSWLERAQQLSIEGRDPANL